MDTDPVLRVTVDPAEYRECCGSTPSCPVCRAREWAPYPFPKLNGAQWQQVRFLLTVRTGGYCEGCGGLLDGNTREATVHHRRPQRMGGSSDHAINGLANLMLLCGGRLGGVVGCHGRIESERTWAVSHGLIVPTGSYLPGMQPPEIAVPITLPSMRRVLLSPIAPVYERYTDTLSA